MKETINTVSSHIDWRKFALNYFVIRLALSYINAVEAQYHYRIPPENSVLVVLYQEKYPVDLQHIKSIIDPLLWKEIHYFPYNMASFKKANGIEIKCNFFSDLIKDFFPIKRYVAQLNSICIDIVNVEKVFVGNEDTASMRHLANELNPQKIYNLDEGFKTFNIFSEKNRKGDWRKYSKYIQDLLKGWLAKIIYGYKIGPLKDVIYFSSYGLPGDMGNSIVINEFKKIRLQTDRKPILDCVYFLGQPLSEFRLITEELNFYYLQIIKEHYSPRQVEYLPHRDESPDKLEKLQSKFGIYIQKSSIPVEYTLANTKVLPSHIASFYSSALQNILHIFGETIKIEAFYLQTSIFQNVDKTYVADIEECYDYFRKIHSSNFNIVELSEVDNKYKAKYQL